MAKDGTQTLSPKLRARDTATVRVYRGVRPGPDGTIGIAFIPYRKEAPFVNAIEVLPTPDNRMLPVRWQHVRRPCPSHLTKSGWPIGIGWVVRTYSVTSRSKVRSNPNSIKESAMGNFSYAIPVATGGKYTLTLRFAETWFGQGRPGGGGIGARIFDVYCNGRVLLKDFDVMREAGGGMRQMEKNITGARNNCAGEIESAVRAQSQLRHDQRDRGVGRRYVIANGSRCWPAAAASPTTD